MAVSYTHLDVYKRQDIGCMDFAGGYPGNLHEEINNFSVIALSLIHILLLWPN